MEQDNVKWKYNAAKHEVVEQPTMDEPGNHPYVIQEHRIYKEHTASLRSIPVSGKVDWKDWDDVTGKFTIEPYFYHPGTCAIPIKQEQPDTGVMKRAIISGTSLEYSSKNHTNKNITQKESLLKGLECKGFEEVLYSHETVMNVMEEYKNQSQEQDNVTGGDTSAEEILVKYSNEDLTADLLVKILHEYAESRLQSIEASNNFHKQQVHEAIIEQLRLQKENEALKKLLDIASCPQVLIDNPTWLFGKATDEDKAWAKEVIKKWEESKP